MLSRCLDFAEFVDAGYMATCDDVATVVETMMTDKTICTVTGYRLTVTEKKTKTGMEVLYFNYKVESNPNLYDSLFSGVTIILKMKNTIYHGTEQEANKYIQNRFPIGFQFNCKEEIK